MLWTMLTSINDSTVQHAKTVSFNHSFFLLALKNDVSGNSEEKAI